jgi:hypothetical protein
MAGVAGNAFKQKCLLAGLNHTAQDQDQYMILFTNDHTPAVDDVLADYTEATFSGYTQKVLTGSSWGVTSADPSVASYAQQEFVSDDDQTPETQYGYAVFLADDTFVGAERFASPQVIQNDLDQIAVTPRIRLYQKV